MSGIGLFLGRDTDLDYLNTIPPVTNFIGE